MKRFIGQDPPQFVRADLCSFSHGASPYQFTGADPGVFDWRGPKFSSERSVEIFCDKLLLPHTLNILNIPKIYFSGKMQ